MPHHPLTALQDLISCEDPIEIGHYIDDAMSYMVQFSDNEGYVTGMGHRYILLREVRNAFYKVAYEQFMDKIGGETD